MNFKNGLRRAATVFFVLLLTFTACVSPALAKIGQTYVCRVNGLRVHKSASGASEIVGKLKRGDKVVHVASSKGWWKIETPKGATGYVYRTYLQATSQKLKKNAYYTIYKTSRAVVRKGPRAAAEKLGTIKRGTVVRLLNMQGGWGRVKVSGGNTGWVQLKFLNYYKG